MAEGVEMRFDINRYSKDGNRRIGKNKKVIDKMKDKLGGKIMAEFVALRAKMYVQRKLDENLEDKRCKAKKIVQLSNAPLLLS